MRKYLPLIFVPILFASLCFGDVSKGLVGKEDLKMWDGVTKTFTRESSSGRQLTLNKVDWPGVDILQVYGGGTDRTDVTISNAMRSIGSSNNVSFYIAPGTWTIANSITITSNINLIVPSGAIFSITSGKTLTIDGGLEAGLYRIVSGSGNMSITSGDVVYSRPEWWYSGSGSWDTAIEEAIEVFCQSYTDSATQVQGGTVLLSPKVYTVTDTITVQRPVKIKGEYYEYSTGPSRYSGAGTRIDSDIADTGKDVIEITGTDRGDSNNAVHGTVLEGFAINGSDGERDGIRVSATGYIYGLVIKDINIYNTKNNGLTVTSANDGFHYSLFQNIRCYSVGNDSFSFESGSDDTEGIRIVDCRSGTAGQYGFYATIHGFKLENFIEDSSVTSGIYLSSVTRAHLLGCTTETGDSYGFNLNASYFNTFTNCVATNNVGSQFYLAGGSYNNVFISCSLNQVGSEKHITYATAADKNNVWLCPWFFETKAITDSGSQNVYIFDRVSTDGTPRQYITTGGDNDVIYFDSILGTVREVFAAKTAAYTVTATDKYIWCNGTGGAFTVTLPTGANSLRGQIFTIKKTDSSGNAITVDGAGSEQIEGSDNVSLSSQWDYVSVTWDGSQWLKVGSS